MLEYAPSLAGDERVRRSYPDPIQYTRLAQPGALFVYDSIRTVIFDLDGTLVFHEPDSADVIRGFCAEIGRPLSAEVERQVRRRRHAYFLDSTVRDRLPGLSSDDFWLEFNHYLLEVVCAQGDLDGLARQLTARYAQLELTYYCPDVVRHTLAELRSRGYRLGLITNRLNVGSFNELLLEVDLYDQFELALASGEVGVHKPYPGIFAIALERMGAEPGESLYVGDNYWADVVGARRAGLTPALLDPLRLFPEADCLVLDRVSDLLERLC